MLGRRLLLVGVCFVGLQAFGQAQKDPGQKQITRNPHGSLKIPCENCHSSLSWKPIRSIPEFDHDKTGYPLRGMHEKVPCTECHVKLVFTNVGQKCADCHADIHRGQFGANCASCGRAYSHRIPLAGLKCASQKRREELDLLLLRLWESGNPAPFAGFPSAAPFPQPSAPARRIKSPRYGYVRPLFRSGA